MTLSDWQFQFVGPQGTASFGASTNVGVVTVTGLEDLPDVRQGDVPRPNAPGMLAGYDFTGGRTLTFTMDVTAGSYATVGLALDALKAAFQVAETQAGGPANTNLTYQLPGQGNRAVACRVTKRQTPVDINYQGGLASLSVQMVAVDPNVYSAVLQSATVGLTVAAGGWVFPWTFPWTFTTSTGGLVFAANTGTVACPPLITITGPCNTPRIEQQTTGQTLAFNTVLASTDTLVVDCFAGSAVLNGTASRVSVLAPGSQFFQIPPGTSTIGFYSADSSATGAQMTVEWASAWS